MGLGVNAAYAIAKAASGVRNDPFMGFNFLLEIEGLVVGGFSKVSGLSLKVETLPVKEGGLNTTVHQLPGRAEQPANLVLEHGITAIDTLWGWMEDVLNGDFSTRNGSLFMLNSMHIPVMWWDFKDAYPVSWEGPGFDAESAAIGVEKVELVHRGITRSTSSRALAYTHAAASAALDITRNVGR